MLHLEAEWPSKQNILTADMILAELFSVARFLRFGEKNTFFEEKDFFIICLKQIFLCTTKFGGRKKYLG